MKRNNERLILNQSFAQFKMFIILFHFIKNREICYFSGGSEVLDYKLMFSEMLVWKLIVTVLFVVPPAH
jgi:hypothetical protein